MLLLRLIFVCFQWQKQIDWSKEYCSVLTKKLHNTKRWEYHKFVLENLSTNRLKKHITSPRDLYIMTLVISIGFAILLSSKPSSFETQLNWYGILRKAHVISRINWPNSSYLNHNSYDTLGYDLGRPILKIISCCPLKCRASKTNQTPESMWCIKLLAVRGRFCFTPSVIKMIMSSSYNSDILLTSLIVMYCY